MDRKKNRERERGREMGRGKERDPGVKAHLEKMGEGASFADDRELVLMDQAAVSNMWDAC